MEYRWKAPITVLPYESCEILVLPFCWLLNGEPSRTRLAAWAARGLKVIDSLSREIIKRTVRHLNLRFKGLILIKFKFKFN